MPFIFLCLKRARIHPYTLKGCFSVRENLSPSLAIPVWYQTLAVLVSFIYEVEFIRFIKRKNYELLEFKHVRYDSILPPYAHATSGIARGLRNRTLHSTYE